MDGALGKKCPSTTHPGERSLLDVSTQGVARGQTARPSTGTIPTPASCRHKGRYDVVLKVLQLGRGTPGGPGPKPCEVVPSPTTGGGPSSQAPRRPSISRPGSPDDGSNACPATSRRHPKARQPLTQRPVSHRRKPAFALSVLKTHQPLVKNRRNWRTWPQPPFFSLITHTHVRHRSAQTRVCSH